jgi:50S ribosomal subunit-associated GTPase HflX
MLEVWNKIDLAPDSDLPRDLPQISCQTGEGMGALIAIIEKKLEALAGKQKYVVEYRI